MVEHHNYLYLETIGGQSFNFSFNAVVLQIIVTVKILDKALESWKGQNLQRNLITASLPKKICFAWGLCSSDQLKMAFALLANISQGIISLPRKNTSLFFKSVHDQDVYGIAVKP
jgi:hypothetical protein